MSKKTLDKLAVLNGALFALDGLIELFDRSGALRIRAAAALVDRKSITNEELEASAEDVRDRIQEGRDNDRNDQSIEVNIE